MPASVHLLCGPAGAGKTGRLWSRYQEVARSAVGAALWIGPTRRGLDDLLLRQGPVGCLAPNLLTFQECADRIVRTNDPGARFLSDLHRRMLVEELVSDLHGRRRLKHFDQVAETRGFPDSILALLSELKRREVRSDEFARAAIRADLGPKLRQCARLYARYQERLRQHQLFDAEGRSWYARDLLKQGKRRPFEVVQAVFLDGFTDFTPTQIDILDALRTGVREIWITLPDEESDLRAELFSGPRSALEDLQHLGPTVGWLSGLRSESKPAGLTHLERQLFRPLRRVEPFADATGLARLEAPGLVGEARLVARRIKSLLLEGTPAGAVVVTARDLGPYADLLGEVFTEYGIPHDIEGNQPLSRSPAVATLLRAVRLPEDGWPFGAVTALLRCDYFRPEWPETVGCPEIAQHAEALLRLVGEPRGREAYLRAVQRWADQPPASLEDDEAGERRRRRTHELAQKCRPFLEHFFHAWDDAPSRATPAEHGAWVRRLCDDLGIGLAAAEQPRDRAAQERLWDELERWTRHQSGAALWDRARFGRLLHSLAAGSGLARTARGPGRVRVVSAEAATQLEPDYLFILGLGERSFPRLVPPAAILDDAERHALRQARVDLAEPDSLRPAEMLLFYQLVTKARRQLFLSYPAVDEQGQALLPSSFLSAVLDCFDPEESIPVERKKMLIEQFDREEPLCPAEFRVRVAAAGTLAEAKFPTDLAANLRAAAHMAAARFTEQEFSPYDGRFRDPVLLAELGQRFGPERVFSPTALETYVACPFKFLQQHGLHLEPLEEPREEIESTDRGLVVHRALARLHRQLQQAGIDAPTDAVDGLLAERLEHAVRENAGRGSAASEVLWQLEGQRLLRAAARYRQHWQRFLAPWEEQHIRPEPYLFETSFGLPAADGESPAEPLIIRVDGVEIRIGGRIDRVDVTALPDGVGFWIIDYKTGRGSSYTAAELEGLRRLQLTLYALAVEEVLLADRSARPLGLAYWLVTDTGPKVVLPPRVPISWLEKKDAWLAFRDRLRSWVACLARHIREGFFPLRPQAPDCTATCDYAQMCRISQSRPYVERKTWQLPQV